jgi:signal transduction histidine kinase/CheY-like chemotaxis protein
MRLPQISLRWRVAIGLSLLILMIFAGSGYVQTQRQNEQLREMLSARTERLAGALGKMLTRPLWNVDFERVHDILTDAQQDPAFVFARVRLPDGETVAKLGDRDSEHGLVTATATSVRDGEVLGTVEIGLSTQLMETRTAANIRSTVVVTVLALLILITAALLFLNRVLTPVAAITQAMIQIADRNEGVRVPHTDRPDEIGEMALAVLAFREDARVRRAYEKQLEEARAQAEAASRAKSEFLANMSHEIRTPINAILGMTQLLYRTRLDARQRDYLSKSWSATQNLLAIINDILDFSKIEAGQLDLERTDFAFERVLTDVANVVGLKAEEKNLELVFHTERDVPSRLRGDPLRLGQILLNLTSNAVKFTPSGEVVVHTRVAEDDGERVLLSISVTDTGVGMSAEQQDRLFRAFSQGDTSTTRRFGGTGLGLVICHRLVRLMGGSIRVRSTQGAGTTFTFDIRLDHAQASTSAAVLRRTAIGDWRVLIVEENASNASALTETFEAWGCRPETVASAQAALHRAQAMRESGETYDLLLIDYRLPGMDGLTLARTLHASHGDVMPAAILMMTNQDSADAGQPEGEPAVQAVVEKPVTGSTLYDAILEAREDIVPLKTAHREPSDLSDAELAPLRGHRVLLVEDNEINQQVGAKLLADAGVRVDLADNGREALEALRQRRYDIVLMDVQMPVLDGYQATQEIRSDPTLAHLPVIALTAHAMSGERENCLNAGMDDYLSKPVEADHLYRMVLRWIPSGVRTRTPPEASAEAQPPAPAAATPPAAAPARARAAEDASAPGGLPRQLPGLDVETGLRYVANKPDMYRRMAARFRERYGAGTRELRQMLEEGRRDEAHRAAHSLKSLAGTLGASELQPAAAELERTLADGEAQVPETLIARVGDRLDEVLSAIDRIDAPEDGSGQATA